MARIKILKDEELVGATSHEAVYPVSSTQAIFSQNSEGQTPPGVKPKLEDRLQDIEASVSPDVTKKTVLYLDITNSQHPGDNVIEITGQPVTFTLSGYVEVETFGDLTPQRVPVTDLDNKQLIVTYQSIETPVAGSATQDNKWQGECTMSTLFPGTTATATFSCTYNNVTWTVTEDIDFNLRKYFGFSTSQPSTGSAIKALGANHFSDDVKCTVTVPMIDEGFQHIYFAVPNNMTITQVSQPDAFNFPIDITSKGTVTVDGNIYKLYATDDEINSIYAKRLTII